MGIMVNPGAWNSIFAVPSCVADEHLKKANGQQLKVLLFVMRHNNENIDVEAVAAGTGMSGADVKDAMQYWVEVGLLSNDGNFKETKNVNTGTEKLLELPDVVPTYDQVAARTLESPELRFLFNEAQMRLGKTIGYADQAKLLMIHDCYGLPVEVILTIIEYSVSEGKVSMKYIEKVAKDWAEKEVNTLEAADEYIKQIHSEKKLWNEFKSMFSVDTPNYTDKRMSYVIRWRKEWKQSPELIYYAYEQTVNATNKFSFEYMNKILENWYNSGIKSPADAIKASKEYKEQKKVAVSSTATQATSYDSSKYIEKAKGPIVYKRREQNG